MALPSQEEKKGTYLEYSTLEWAIENRLTNGQPEGETSRVWNAILSKIFRIEDGYMTGPEMLHEGGRADLFTAHIVFNPMHEEKKFLVVECKAPGRETDDDLWAEAADQLARHLKSFKPRNRLYGAIANGKALHTRIQKSDQSHLKNPSLTCHDLKPRVGLSPVSPRRGKLKALGDILQHDIYLRPPT
ncbi:uncharacterized protein VDAG_03086 [Verticillium dahliae VdLs.17]|uniref:Type I restriction enzyme R protein N-terminal domain-containing protein n=1 Tax=Verticillium dahliae (strain VdLs.17 / ATCC MYA-4575 / FGSC 10137) TaxID=498257 RepID=G2X063_VERDV|nr:uncharacterized protein VDAG_03086 [Verticillium dahliae VdLs.17]EGY21646.1 hypothetical protein VDAG_03086 [Verticillium dahliae VdLs.17]